MYAYKKKRQLRTMYEGRTDLEEFIEQMAKKLKLTGKFIKDEFAPDDEEEHYWIIFEKVQFHFKHFSPDLNFPSRFNFILNTFLPI